MSREQFSPEPAWWPAEPARAYRECGYWAGRSIGEHLQTWVDRTPESTCLVEDGTRLTFAEFLGRVDAAAAGFRSLGLVSGDRLVLQLPNSWQFVVLLFACFRSGVVPLMALPTHRKVEILSLMERSGARALIVPGEPADFDHQGMAAQIATELGRPVVVMVRGGAVAADHVDVDALCAAPDRATRPPAEPPRSSAVALYLLSGGTTGAPKIIPRTHDDYAYMATRSAVLSGVDQDTVYLAVLPLAHGYPMAGPGVIGTILAGGRVVVLPSPSPERALRTIAAERVTFTSLVPAALVRWLEYRQNHHSLDLSSLRTVQVAAARLARHLAVAVGPQLGCRLQQVYGMAEGLLCLTRPDDPADVLIETQGRPISPGDELLVVDEDGEPVPAGTPGVLLTRGPYTPRSYCWAGPADNEAHRPDGFYRTGDVVLLRPDGNLVVTGRVKDVINRGGEKIWAEEVEGLVSRLPSVAAVAAVGAPDPELGERICLYVVPVAGFEVDLDEIAAHMRATGVAPFKMPELLFTLQSMPLTNVGKIDKMKLREDVRARLGAAASTAERNLA